MKYGRLRMLAAMTMALFLVVMLCGCDMYTAKTVTTFDTNATVARAIADSAAKGTTPPADMAFQLECFARTFQNLSDAGHWKPPTYPKAPTTQPTTLPWDNKQ